MFCTTCGSELKEGDRFCSRCGARTEAGRSEAHARRLTLDKRNKKIAGVCSGFAQYFDADVTLVRVLWLAGAIITGVGFLAYLAAWLIMPNEENLAPRFSPNPAPHAN